MQMDKKYIEDNLGLTVKTDSNGGRYYELEGEGIFIETQEGTGWVFIPNEPIGIVYQKETFEHLYL